MRVFARQWCVKGIGLEAGQEEGNNKAKVVVLVGEELWIERNSSIQKVKNIMRLKKDVMRVREQTG